MGRKILCMACAGFIMSAGLLLCYQAVYGVQQVFAAKDNPGKALGHNAKHKGKKKGHDKHGDKDRGPSVPGIPVLPAVLIGISAIGGGIYFLKKKR